MWLDAYLHFLDPLKSRLMDLSRPLYNMANLPHILQKWGEDKFASKDELLVETARLQAENLVLRAKVQKLAALAIENVRLRELLNATTLLEDNVQVAEIIAVSPDPTQQYVMLNRGAEDGVFVGQAVVDANGLFGQVMEVASHNARVLLISDQRHAVPVLVDRNGVRAVIEGANDFYQLELPHVALTTDIVAGDVLSTSGLGGLFPVGYPVARVAEVRHDPGQAFAIVKARPFAQLDRSRYVLLLFDKPVAP